ncbi:MAG: amidohydrolase [Candidatus Bathyarchaeota archaeon]|nr:amidohydrolase [Candidatus Bathyarchaeota archaeon]MDH5495247.1 amidohydrolase [Candidatus Bathyarchaeota archaeon]
MNLIIEGGTIVTVSRRGTLKNGAIVIEGDKIVEVGKTDKLKPKYRRYEKINAKNKVVIPGLINTHHHAAMSILRGYADDLDLKTWLEKRIWPVEKCMTSRDIYAGALLTAVESIMGGTTTINTMYHYTDKYNEAQAFAEASLRGVVGHVCFSWRKKHDRKALESLVRTWHNKKGGLIRVSVDPHAPYTVDSDYMGKLRVFTQELNEKYASHNSPIIWHIHVAETSDEPRKTRQAFNVDVKGGVVEYLDALGVLSCDVVAAHCVHLTKKDVEILRNRRVKVAHNPVSNLKLASGISPVQQLLKKGVTVSLGTDSSCSNNSSDMFEVMKVAALLHKGISRDPTVLSAEQILRMATINGAKALCWNREIGSIERGKKADLAIVDFKKPHLTPVYNETSHLVYSAKNADVDTVIINGKIVMENRKIKTVNVDKVMALVEKTKYSLLERVDKSP